MPQVVESESVRVCVSTALQINASGWARDLQHAELVFCSGTTTSSQSGELL